MPFYDAHCHLQDERLATVYPSLQFAYEKRGVEGVIVNGTSELDWDAVKDVAADLSVVVPSYGLHPWKVAQRSERWQEKLLAYWQDPEAGVGEIGLDRWIRDFDIKDQLEVFLWQFRQGTALGKPISVHCLKAWGLLFDTLRSEATRPENGFLLHSFGGPKEMIAPFASLGAYFSLSGYFAFNRKHAQQEAFKKVPLDRILIETDAPDMLGPDSVIATKLSIDQKEINHPSNIVSIYGFAAELYGIEFNEFVEIVGQNMKRFLCHK